VKEKIKQILNKKWVLPGEELISKNLQSLSIAEKIFFYALIVVFAISCLVLLKQANDKLMIDVPANGGFLKEGIVGSPRFVNPVLAVSDVDKDLTELVYSGLLKADKDGGLVPDLAQNYTVSDDGLQYSFTLRDNIYFQDGTKVTADDVEFTIKTIQDSTIKSPKRPNFYDVKVEKISDNQIRFTLKQPYSPFLENLTVGILPKHLWGNLDADQFPLSQYNVEPVGSGPYKVSKMQTLQKNMLLVPTYYELTPFSKYALGKPFIDKLIINFYSDEKSLIDAYNKGTIESINSISPENMPSIKKQSGADVQTTPLPRVFAVFFNQNQNEALADTAVRKALNMTVDRQKIVDEVLGGYGQTLFGPIPKGLIAGDDQPSVGIDFDTASSTLAKDGWKKNATTSVLEKQISKKKTIELDITISTLNSPDLVKASEIIKSGWERLGAKVIVQQFELGDLQQNIIRPRKFEALLYGEAIGRDMDLFAFWHSSQRNDPGINVVMYANSKVDKLLEDARATLDPQKKTSDYESFESEISKDVPAIFLYSPEFIYITPEKVNDDSLGLVTLPYERFLNINSWYIETNKVWKIFE
jgi:peptide/nickel transport system substrate-binding protein